MSCAFCQHYYNCEMAKLRYGFCGPLVQYLQQKNNKEVEL